MQAELTKEDVRGWTATMNCKTCGVRGQMQGNWEYLDVVIHQFHSNHSYHELTTVIGKHESKPPSVIPVR